MSIKKTRVFSIENKLSSWSNNSLMKLSLEELTPYENAIFRGGNSIGFMHDHPYLYTGLIVLLSGLTSFYVGKQFFPKKQVINAQQSQPESMLYTSEININNETYKVPHEVKQAYDHVSQAVNNLKPQELENLLKNHGYQEIKIQDEGAWVSPAFKNKFKYTSKLLVTELHTIKNLKEKYGNLEKSFEDIKQENFFLTEENKALKLPSDVLKVENYASKQTANLYGVTTNNADKKIDLLKEFYNVPQLTSQEDFQNLIAARTSSLKNQPGTEASDKKIQIDTYDHLRNMIFNDNKYAGFRQQIKDLEDKYGLINASAEQEPVEGHLSMSQYMGTRY